MGENKQAHVQLNCAAVTITLKDNALPQDILDRLEDLRVRMDEEFRHIFKDLRDNHQVSNICSTVFKVQYTKDTPS